MEGYRNFDSLQIVQSGPEFFECLEKLIRESQESIFLLTYILVYDTTGKKIIDEMIAASRRGVKVILMLDAFGSVDFPESVIESCKSSGMQFRFFAPVLSGENIYFGRRMHFKIAVADGTKSLTGGINIADKYYGTDEKIPWLDFGLYCEGSVNAFLHQLCSNYFLKKHTNITFPDSAARIEATDKNAEHIRFRLNDRARNKNEVHQSYIQAIKNSRTSIFIVGSYFIPGRKIRKLLQQASKRGVKIKILLAGNSDVKTAQLAQEYLYRFYLKNKISIYEWTNSVMHGKAMVVDNDWMTLGSYNVNFLSHYLSIELNADVKSAHVSNFELALTNIATNKCRLVDDQYYLDKLSLLRRIQLWLNYNMYRLISQIVVHENLLTGNKP